MRKSRNHHPTQLVLELARQSQVPPASKQVTGLVAALADLLLEALGVEGLTTKGGSGDERQDHA